MSDQGYSLPTGYLTAGGPPAQALLDAFLSIVRALNAQTIVLSQLSIGGSVSSIDLIAIPAPATPPANHFTIFMDIADGKVKALGPSGTLTDIANP